MTTYLSLPFPNNEQDVASNLAVIESMLEQNERIERQEKTRWDALSPDQKRGEMERPSIEMGMKKCNICGAVPHIWFSQMERFGFYPVVWCFDEASQSIAHSSVCEKHSNREKLMALRFDTLDELRQFWNELT